MAWTYGLLDAMKDPRLQIHNDYDIVVIKDCYPKAEVHFLVLPWKNIPSIKDLTGSHLTIIKRMDLKAREIAREKGGGRKFKFGYHAEPSMKRLHMHVISDDFNSPALKTKKHWNSYTTNFFIPSEKVIKDLESIGRVNLPSTSQSSLYLKTPLKCHKCPYSPGNMPALKLHLAKHTE